MKKFFALCCSAIFIVSTAVNVYAKDLVIGERFFITQINAVYQNPKSYLGSTISYEGIFDQYDSYDGSEPHSLVFRYGPGCCGPDALAGFEVVWDKPYPKKDAWVRAEGVLEEYTIDRVKFLRLRLISLVVLEKRGKEVLTR
ncbi:MAG: hypothetical protein LBB93_03355 [Elusimicrobiota bacterium]|jgi:uncharacterized membrane protein YcgQ (UPF0703/DUF1980 family)|nr:hypothetical protein [Elusimicrobiota bacterium]